MKNRKEFRSLSEALIHQSTSKNRGITFINETGDLFLSYSDLYHDACMICNSMQDLGIEKQSEIVFQLDNNELFIKMFWASILGGFIPVPLHTSGVPGLSKKIKNIWRKLNNPYIVSGKEYSGKKNLLGLTETKRRLYFAEDLLKNGVEGTVIPDDQYNEIAFIQFSSGSGGDPKGVVLRHRQILNNLYGFLERIKCISSDSTLSWMPLIHDMGLIGFHIAPLLIGLNHSIIPTGLFIRRPMIWLEKASRYKSTILNATTTSLDYFLKYFDKKKDYSPDLSNVRLIFVGAEPVSKKICSEFTEKLRDTGLPENTFFPVYGLAEATLAVTFPDPGEEMESISLHREKLLNFRKISILKGKSDYKSSTFVGLGYPIKGLDLRITDINRMPLPQDTIGIVEIKGSSVTEGYYNDYQKTIETINKDGWLNTGDLGFLKDNRLYITGRFKDVIFKNGQNIYSHDLESIIKEMEGFNRENVVVVGLYNSELQEDEIIVFIRVRRRDPVYFKKLSEKISKYLISGTGISVNKIIGIKKIPKTTSGKIQRYILREEYKKGTYNSSEYMQFSFSESENSDTSPHREEKNSEPLDKITELFRKHLANKSISEISNFFQSGGNSLQAIALLSEIDQNFKKTVNLPTFFLNPTPEAISQLIMEKNRRELISMNKIADLHIGENILLPSQKRIYFLSMFVKNNTAFNIPFAIKVRGKIDVSSLENSIKRIIDRHEVLRTSFFLENGEVISRVKSGISFSLDKKRIKKEKTESEIQRFIKPFSPDHPPLFRIALYSYSEESHLLIFDFHHLIMDGYSIGIFLKELSALYNEISSEDMVYQFRDYMKWRTTTISQEEYNRQRDFWMKKFQYRPETKDLPTDYLRPNIRKFNGSNINFSLNDVTVTQLSNTSVTNGCTEFSIFLAAYTLFLYLLTGEQSPVIGIPILGRPPGIFNNTMGMFVNIVPFSIEIEQKRSCLTLFSIINREIALSYMNSYYQFEDLIDKRFNMSRNPLFDTIFVYHNWIDEFSFSENLDTDFFPITNSTTRFDLSMNIYPVKNSRYISLEYSTGLFNENTIRQFKNSFLLILKKILKEPDKSISNIIENIK